LTSSLSLSFNTEKLIY